MNSANVPELATNRLRHRLEAMVAEERVRWALESLPGPFVATSSFGIQSPVLLHLVSRIKPDLRVVLVDTGYLFPESYVFMEELTKKLDLNVQVVSSSWTAARLEATYGRLWEQGTDGLDLYNRITKVEPMEEALRELGVGTWISGLRREQASSRTRKPVLERRADGVNKLYPLIDWTNQDIQEYLAVHALPHHPLWEQGYVSVGDWHTSRPWTVGMTEEETRFFGLKRECGLHVEVAQ